MRAVTILVAGAMLALLMVFIVQHDRPIFRDATGSPDTAFNPADYAGTIYVDTDGMRLYTNDKVGLKFRFPAGWHLGNNALGYGSLQLSNYDASGSGKDAFAADAKVNRIHAVLVSTPSYDGTEYQKQTQETDRLEINGQTVVRQNIEFVHGGRVRVYFVPVPPEERIFVSVLITGNPENLYVLDELVRSIQWVR